MLHMVLNCLLGGNPNPQQKSLPQQKISIKATLRFKETLSVNQPFSPATAASQASLQETTRFGSGQAVKRLEDQQLLLGAGVYANDVSLPQQTHLVFLRSPYPHARIARLDTSAAKAWLITILRREHARLQIRIERLTREFPPQREQTELGELVKGLPVRLSLQRRSGELAAKAELALGERARFFPSDAALASWMAQAEQGQAQIVYEDNGHNIVAVRTVTM